MKIPNEHQTVMPYLILPRAANFLEFVKEVFDAKEMLKVVDDNNEIRHAEVSIGGSCIMFGGANEEWKPQPAGLYIYVENADASYRKALEHGAASVMEPRDESYGRNAGVKDPFGNTWWLITP